ncbi:MAG TPA: hypothetical protein VNA12_03275 [Mycobacteriales bacterium]|nr:hypothetical protein [Mycobacteriales bacterium]
MAFAAAGLPVAGPAQAAGVDPCASSAGGSAPVLHRVVISQGVGEVQPLVRGKTTIVRLLLSAPSCAPAGSQQLLSATLTVADGAQAATVPTTPAVLGPAYPLLDTYSNAPTPASPGNPLFQIPALAGSNTTNGQITVTFRASVTYQYVASAGAAPETRTATYTQSPADPTKPIAATVTPKTNALRVLVVPMADTSGVTGAPPQSQFPTAAGSPLPAGITQAADTVLQNGMQALSRLLPVRDGIGDLSNVTSPGPVGLRYRLLTASSIDLGLRGLNVMNSSGKFCGSGGNFEAITTQLANFLSAWNKQNSNAQADRVLGVVWQEVSVGGGSCAEGMANMSGTQAWTRLLSDNAPDGGTSASAASPYVGRGTSMTGPIIAMELAHTLGSLPEADPRSRSASGGYSPHSPNVSADGASALQTYNTTLATWLSGALSVMRYSGTSGGTTASNAPSAWNNNTGLLERDDYRYVHCALTPGMASALCPYNSSVGATGGAPAGSAIMLGGITDGTIAGTSLHSYTADGVELTSSQPSAPVRLIQRDASGLIIPGPLGNQGVPLTRSDTHHGTDLAHEIGERTHGSISAAMALAPGAATFELWLGQPPVGSGPCQPGITPVGGCFYARAAGSSPTMTSSTGSSSLANVQNFSAAAGDDVSSALSPDGKTLAWATTSGIRLQHRDPLTGGPSGSASAAFAGTAPSWSRDGNRLAYATAAGDIYQVSVDRTMTPPTIGSPKLVYNHTVQQSLTLQSTLASSPSFDPTGQSLAVAINGGVWRIAAEPQAIPANGVTCDLVNFAPTGTCDSLTRVGRAPSWGWTGGTNGGGLVAFELTGGISTLDPNSLGASALGYPTTARVANGTSPAWGGLLLGFIRGGSIWIADPTLATTSTWDNQTQVTAGPSDAAPSMSATGGVVSFDRPAAQTGRDVFTGLRTDDYSLVSFTSTTQGDPRLLEADVYQSCGHGLEPVTVFRKASSTSSGPPASATFTFDYDDSRGCPGGSLLAQVTNGFLSSPMHTIRTFPASSVLPPTLTPAIASPTQGATYFQYDHVIAAASAISSTSGTNPADLSGSWSLTGPAGSGYSNTPVGGSEATATRLLLNPPVNGWTPGTYTLTLQVTGGATTTTSYVVLPDPGHKGYNAGVAFNPHTLYVPSSGNYVTVTVIPQGQKLSAIDPSTVAITEVGKSLLSKPIKVDATAGKTAWAANSDGSYTAKFSRQALSCVMSKQGLVGFWVPVVVSGSGSGGVSFTGFDTKYPMTTPATSPTSCN